MRPHPVAGTKSNGVSMGMIFCQMITIGHPCHICMRNYFSVSIEVQNPTWNLSHQSMFSFLYKRDISKRVPNVSMDFERVVCEPKSFAISKVRGHYSSSHLSYPYPPTTRPVCHNNNIFPKLSYEAK